MATDEYGNKMNGYLDNWALAEGRRKGTITTPHFKFTMEDEKQYKIRRTYINTNGEICCDYVGVEE